MIDKEVFLRIVEDLDYYINNYKNMSKKEKESFIEKEKQLLGDETLFFDKELIYKVK